MSTEAEGELLVGAPLLPTEKEGGSQTSEVLAVGPAVGRGEGGRGVELGEVDRARRPYRGGCYRPPPHPPQ